MSARRSHNAASIDVRGPIDWMNELNHGLSSWHLNLPGMMGGPVWHDLCGNHNGALTNAAPLSCWYGSTRNGQWGALRHNGGTDSVSLAAGGGLNAVQTGTISLWACWLPGTQETYVSLSGAVFGRSNNVTFVNQTIALDGTNPTTAKVVWRPYATGTSACVSATSPGIGIWHHILVTYASGSHALYLDGVLEDTGATTGTMATNAAALTLGSLNSSNMIGMFDCVRIFPSRIFTAWEAYDEYQRTARYCDGLLLTRKTRNRSLYVLPELFGSSAVTLGSVGRSQAAGVIVTGSESKALAVVGRSQTSAVVVGGASSKLLAAVGQSASGTAAIVGAASQVLASVGRSTAGSVAIVGSQDRTLAPVSQLATAGPVVSGSSSVALSSVGRSEAGQVIVTAAQSRTIAPVSQLGRGSTGGLAFSPGRSRIFQSRIIQGA